MVRDEIVLDQAGAKVLRQSDLFEPGFRSNQSWADAAPNYALMALWQTFNNKSSKKQYQRGFPAGLGDLGKTVTRASAERGSRSGMRGSRR